MKNKGIFFLVIIILAIALVVVFIVRGQEPRHVTPVATPVKQDEQSKTQSQKQIAPQTVAKSAIKRINAKQRQKLIAEIMKKIAQAAAPSLQGNSGTEKQKEQQERDNETHSAPTGQLEATYINQQMVEILPMIQECYENALAVAEDKNINGRIVVKFTIIGDPELGGVITKSELSEKDQSMSADFQQCVRETMYALQLKAPSNGGQVTVNYPFIFKYAAK